MTRELKFRAWDVAEHKWRIDLGLYVDGTEERFPAVFISGVAMMGLRYRQTDDPP